MTSWANTNRKIDEGEVRPNSLNPNVPGGSERLSRVTTATQPQNLFVIEPTRICTFVSIAFGPDFFRSRSEIAGRGQLGFKVGARGDSRKVLRSHDFDL